MAKSQWFFKLSGMSLISPVEKTSTLSLTVKPSGTLSSGRLGIVAIIGIVIFVLKP